MNCSRYTKYHFRYTKTLISAETVWMDQFYVRITRKITTNALFIIHFELYSLIIRMHEWSIHWNERERE